MKTSPARYFSGIGWPFFPALSAVVALPIVLNLTLGLDPKACAEAFLVLTGTLMLGWWPCSYTMAEDHLLIRTGVLLWRKIPYAEITGVAVCTNYAPAPALSHRRIRIECGNRHEWISPRQRPAFLALLRRKIEATSRT